MAHSDAQRRNILYTLRSFQKDFSDIGYTIYQYEQYHTALLNSIKNNQTLQNIPSSVINNERLMYELIKSLRKELILKDPKLQNSLSPLIDLDEQRDFFYLSNEAMKIADE